MLRRSVRLRLGLATTQLLTVAKRRQEFVTFAGCFLRTKLWLADKAAAARSSSEKPSRGAVRGRQGSRETTWDVRFVREEEPSKRKLIKGPLNLKPETAKKHTTSPGLERRRLSETGGSPSPELQGRGFEVSGFPVEPATLCTTRSFHILHYRRDVGVTTELD